MVRFSEIPIVMFSESKSSVHNPIGGRESSAIARSKVKISSDGDDEFDNVTGLD